MNVFGYPNQWPRVVPILSCPWRAVRGRGPMRAPSVPCTLPALHESGVYGGPGGPNTIDRRAVTLFGRCTLATTILPQTCTEIFTGTHPQTTHPRTAAAAEEAGFQCFPIIGCEGVSRSRAIAPQTVLPLTDSANVTSSKSLSLFARRRRGSIKRSPAVLFMSVRLVHFCLLPFPCDALLRTTATECPCEIKLDTTTNLPRQGYH